MLVSIKETVRKQEVLDRLKIRVHFALSQGSGIDFERLITAQNSTFANLVARGAGSLFESGLEGHSESPLEVEISVDVVLVRRHENEVDVVPRQRERSRRRGPPHRNLSHVPNRDDNRQQGARC